MAQSITLQTSDSDIVSSDVLGRLSFAASSESSGSDAVLIGASIYAMAESNFTEISNATSIIFATASSESAIAKLKISSQGHFLPILDKTYDIGASGTKFRNVFAENGKFENISISNLSDPYEILYITDSSGNVSSTDLLKVDVANTEIDLGGDLIPTSNLAYDLGSSSYKFRDTYTDKVILNSGSAIPATTSNTVYNVSGELYYNNNVVALLPSGGVQGQILQKYSTTSNILEWIDNFATEVRVYVKNTTGSALTKGQAVYINGAQGDHPTIALAIADGESSSSKTLGLLKQNLAINEFGYVIAEGALDGIDTSAASAAGDLIYLSPTTAGGVVYGLANRPTAPNHMVFIGYVVVKQQNNGKVFIKVQNGFELGELHNVATNGTANGTFLQYNTASGLWLASTSGNFTTLQVSTQTASTIASFNGDKSIVSLSTATYPSLTELSYVKGVTSALQTQIDSKAATSTTITAGSGLAGGGSLAANRTIDIGQGDGISVSADSIAVDSTVIRTTGVQTMSGAKTFSAQTVFASGTAAAPGISILGDTDTGLCQISSVGTNSLSISTSGVERVRFTSDGTTQVRANSSNISTSFTYNENGGELVHYDDAQVAATLLDQCSNQTRLLELINGSDLLLGLGGSNTTGSIKFMRAGFNEAMRIDSAGRVGIGLGGATPATAGSSALQVRGDLDIFGNNSDRSITYNVGVGDDGITGWYRGKIAFIPSSATNKISTHIAFFNKDGDNGGSTLTERMRITADGNVGIGTSPSVRLHISRDSADLFRLQNTAANGGTWDFKVGGGGFQNKNLIITRRTDGADSADLIINNTGNVGIAAEPVADYKLFVNGALRSDSATTYPSIIGIKSLTNTSTGTNLESATYGYTTTNGSYSLQGLVTNIFHKIDSGRTNSASAITFVNNNLRNYALTNDAGTISALYGIYNQFGHYNTSAVSPTTTDAIGFNSLFWRATGTITNAYDIYCQDVSSGAAVPNRWGIYITHTGKNYFAGNVGIGAASTSVPEVLSVMQDNNGGRTSILIDNLDQRLKMSCYYQAGVGQYAEIQGFNNAENGYTGLVLNRLGGSVGVGVVPNYRLDVKGAGATSSTVAFHVANSTPTSLFYTRDDGAINTGAAAVSPYNNVTGTAANMVVGSDGFLYRSTSSLRYKTQINDATHGLNEVLKLRSVTFKSQNDGNKIFGGLIAEEVDSAGLTEFVQYDSENRPDAIHYSNMVALLIKAIQEQQTQINQLKNRLSVLEGE